MDWTYRAVRILGDGLPNSGIVVQEIDAKGGIKLLVGKMAVKVDADDVTK